MNYPLQLKFKTIAIAPQISISDAHGKSVAFVRQKIMRFREHSEVFTDQGKQHLVANINANKIIDWSARYNFTDAAGNEIGSVGRKGMRSIWKATYQCFPPKSDSPSFTIEEENPFAKILDGIIGEIPILGFITAYLFQPKYVAKRNSDGTNVMRLTKKPAFFEGRFEINKLAECDAREEMNLMLSYMMLSLLERSRG